jgi:hypothetical protein
MLGFAVGAETEIGAADMATLFTTEAWSERENLKQKSTDYKSIH